MSTKTLLEMEQATLLRLLNQGVIDLVCYRRNLCRVLAELELVS